MKTTLTLTLLFVLLSLVTPAQPVAGTAFFVAPGGRDANAGTLEKPLATLEGARDRIRRLKRSGRLPNGGVTVFIRGGSYELAQTFVLTAQDSGTERAPIVYRRYRSEEVRLIGGRHITGFKPVRDPLTLRRIDETARDQILQTDLRSQGISDFGQLTARGYHRPVQQAGLELFFQDRPMTLARWPNGGWARVASAPAGKDGGRLGYHEDRPRRWIGVDDLWLHGYWAEDWADSYVKVDSIDPVNREIATREPHGVFGYSAGQRYYALNLLEELDEPGEWYLDRRTGQLYFWPPAPLDQRRVYISLLPAIVSMHNVSHLSLVSLTLEICRGTAVEVMGGRRTLIAGCTIRNTGNDAVSIVKGVNNGVKGCDIYQTGEGGIRLRGGDRKTLASGDNFANNNHIHHYSRWCRTYHPAIWLSGVGNRAVHNLIHDAPHAGIMFDGNEHWIEFNEIHNVGQETADVGAVYTFFQDWTNRGNVIRYNFFHDLTGFFKQGIITVYLDDAASGTTVYGNVFSNVQRAVLIGGGRDNTVENNLFWQCATGVSMDARVYVKKETERGAMMRLYEKLKEVNHDLPPYSDRYPQLAMILDEEPFLPRGNRLLRNLFSKGTWLQHDEIAGVLVAEEDNITDGELHFTNSNGRGFPLVDDSLAYKIGFKMIPTDKIGLYVDGLRPKLPFMKR